MVTACVNKRQKRRKTNVPFDLVRISYFDVPNKQWNYDLARKVVVQDQNHRKNCENVVNCRRSWRTPGEKLVTARDVWTRGHRQLVKPRPNDQLHRSYGPIWLTRSADQPIGDEEPKMVNKGSERIPTCDIRHLWSNEANHSTRNSDWRHFGISVSPCAGMARMKCSEYSQNWPIIGRRSEIQDQTWGNSAWIWKQTYILYSISTNKLLDWPKVRWFILAWLSWTDSELAWRKPNA